MSKIGKNPIMIPDKTEVSVLPKEPGKRAVVTVTGPLGSLSRSYADEVSLAVENGSITVTPKNDSKFSRSLWGTVASHVKNMIQGVHTKYERKLDLQGVGYKVELQGKVLKLSVGFSHPVTLDIPEGIAVALDKNLITISGIDKEAVGQFASVIRAAKPPEPYKGKGIRYVGEYVRQKQGKKAVG